MHRTEGKSINSVTADYMVADGDELISYDVGRAEVTELVTAANERLIYVQNSSDSGGDIGVGHSAFHQVIITPGGDGAVIVPTAPGTNYVGSVAFPAKLTQDGLGPLESGEVGSVYNGDSDVILPDSSIGFFNAASAPYADVTLPSAVAGRHLWMHNSALQRITLIMRTGDTGAPSSLGANTSRHLYCTTAGTWLTYSTQTDTSAAVSVTPLALTGRDLGSDLWDTPEIDTSRFFEIDNSAVGGGGERVTITFPNETDEAGRVLGITQSGSESNRVIIHAPGGPHVPISTVKQDYWQYFRSDATGGWVADGYEMKLPPSTD